MKHYIKRAKKLGRKLVETYREYGVEIEIADCKIILSLMRYIFTIEPSPGTKVQAVLDRAKDVRYALGLHLVYPYEDTEGASIHLAVSEFDFKENRLLKILRSPAFSKSDKKIPLALGYDIMGNMHIAGLDELQRLLIVGPSGTGKSVALQCIILSIITRCSVDSVKLLLFDIGADTLSPFEKVSHLYHPIVKDTETGIVVLESLVTELDKRSEFGEAACRSLPFIVCIIDEFDDTISNLEDDDAKRFIAAINSVILRGRKYRIILILASHNPTLKNTKVKVNGIVPRIVFQCANHHDSSTALGTTGAEDLPGKGTMLFKSQTGIKDIKYLQGSYVTEPEIERILNGGPVDYNGDRLKLIEPEKVYLSAEDELAAVRKATEREINQELADICIWALRREKIASRNIQEEFHMSKRADSIVDKLFKMGIVSEKHSNQPRKVLPQTIENISPKTMDFLERYGYTPEDVADAIDARCTGNDDMAQI